MPLEFILTAWLEHEIKSAEKLLNGESSDYLLADRGYDCGAFRKILQERDLFIPGKKNRLVTIEYDVHIYKERNFVERFFNRVKHFRRIATRYDKISIMFMEVILTGMLMWLKL
jgi:transposase